MAQETVKSGIDELRSAALDYLQYGVDSGIVTSSYVAIDPRTKKVSGMTAYTTESGVKIRAHSDGSLFVIAEYEERLANKSSVDLTVEAFLPPDNDDAFMTERCVYETLDSITRTVAKNDTEEAAANLAAHLIAIY